MQIEPSTDRTPAPDLVPWPPEQADRNELMEISLTARELGRLLQNGTNRLFIEPLPLTSCVQMRIPLRNLLSSKPNLRYVL